MEDSRIHNVIKVYPKEMSLYVPKVPISRNNLSDNILSDKKNHENDWTVDYIQKSIERTHRILKEYILCNDFTHFFTLTISPDSMDRYNDDLVQSKVKTWLNNIRRHSSLGYIVVPERHKDGALHFHGLITSADNLELYDSGHKDRSGRTIYHTPKYTFGFHDFTEIGNQEAVSNYVRKYIEKQFETKEKFKRRFWATQNLKRPLKYHNVDLSDFPVEILRDTDYGHYGRFAL